MMKMNVIERIIFWLLFALAMGFFSRRTYFLFGLLRLGQRDETMNRLGERTKTALLDVFLQWCNFKSVSSKDLAGIGHVLIFWGFLFFSISYLVFLFIGDGLGIASFIRGMAFSHYLLYIVDIAGLFVLMAIIWAVLRRYVIKAERLERSLEAGIILMLIFLLMISYFALEGFRINLEPLAFQAPIAGVCATFFDWIGLSLELQKVLFTVVWWLHYLILLSFLVYIPYSKHLHILAAPFNIFLKSVRPSGELAPVDLEEAEGFGAYRVNGFTWKQLLNTYACTECSRCDVNCPAFLTDKPLSPKKLLLDIKKNLLHAGPLLHVSENPGNKLDPIPPLLIHNTNAIDTEAMLSCTTCGACIEVCPALNRPMDLIVELRRGLVYEGVFDQGQQVALQRTFDYSNPYAVTGSSRDTVLSVLGIDKATEEEKYDVLYWLGCSAYFDERSQDIARAVSKILERAGLKVAALGAKENCCGDFVRRIGDEGLFQKLASENIETIKGFRFDTVITHCPHGYNTLKNEYPQFGADFKVVHHSVFIRNLLEKGVIKVDKAMEEIIYHDPCYLGRYNNIYDPPREVLNSIAEKLVEFPLCRSNSFCCGAGGGHMWKHEELGTRINDKRIEQAVETGVKTVATSCPFCLAMLEDSLLMKGLGAEMRIKDIAELVQEALC